MTIALRREPALLFPLPLREQPMARVLLRSADLQHLQLAITLEEVAAVLQSAENLHRE